MKRNPDGNRERKKGGKQKSRTSTKARGSSKAP